MTPRRPSSEPSLLESALFLAALPFVVGLLYLPMLLLMP